MASPEEAPITIPDQNKKPSGSAASTILVSSIEAQDKTYIQEFLLSENCYEEVEKLSSGQKRKLVSILVEFLDSPARVDALEMIYKVISTEGDPTGLCKSLIERSSDFNKLVYLKGKLDFLKYMRNKPAEESTPKVEYQE